MGHLTRTLDATLLTEAANHPEVRPHIGLTGALDLAPLVTDPANVCFDGPHGGFILHRIAPGVLEAHSLVTPEGRHGLQRETRAILRYVFSATDVRKVVTKVPVYNAPADALAAASWFSELFTQDEAWPGPHGPCAVSYRVVDLDRWLACDAAVKAEGEAMASIMGVGPVSQARATAMGALALCMKAGNAEKGVWLFNERAALAGWAPATLISQHPSIVYLSPAVLTVTGGEIEALKCQ